MCYSAPDVLHALLSHLAEQTATYVKFQIDSGAQCMQVRNEWCMTRVGQNRMCTPYMAVCTGISLLKTPYIHRTYVCMYGSGQPHVWFWPTL